MCAKLLQFAKKPFPVQTAVEEGGAVIIIILLIIIIIIVRAV